jgi:hypothetical protein
METKLNEWKSVILAVNAGDAAFTLVKGYSTLQYMPEWRVEQSTDAAYTWRSRARPYKASVGARPARDG